MMKKIASVLILLTLVPVSCTKEPVETVVANEDGEGKEIVLDFRQPEDSGAVPTKATAITELPSSLYYMITNTSGSSIKKSGTGTVTDGVIATGVYQTSTPTPYYYFVSNSTPMLISGKTKMHVTTSTDVICGVNLSSGTTVNVTMQHVLARVGTVSVSAEAGYTVSSVSLTLVAPGTGCDFNATDNIYESVSTGSDVVIAGAVGNNANDLYVVPGSYTLNLSYILRMNNYYKSFSKSTTIYLSRGQVHSINVVLDGDATQVDYSVTVRPFTESTVYLPVSS